MDQYCFARGHLLSSVTLPGRSAAAGRVGGRAADTAWRASTVTSHLGDTLLEERATLQKLNIAHLQ